MQTITIVKNQELPAMAFEWRDSSNTLIDYSTGYTFTAKIAPQTTPTVTTLTKSSGITGLATAPNVAIAWSTADLTALTAGVTYVVWLIATRTADSLHRVFSPALLPTIMVIAAPS